MSTLALAFAVVLGACGGSGSTAVAPLTPPPDEGVIPPVPEIPPIPLDLAVTDLVVKTGTQPGTVRLEFTAPGTAGDPAPDAYRIRSSVRHITPSDQAGSVIVPVTASPGTVGTAEAITVSGLSPGRTLQFTVQTVRGGTAGPIGSGAGGRVAGRDVPAAPSNAILLTGPATLSQSGATYVLTRDVTTSGTAFHITAPGITLDLGGHRVVYGSDAVTRYGIVAEYPSSGSTPIQVRNGTIVQSATTGQSGHGLFLRGVDDVRVSYLDVTVSGPGAHGIYVTEAEDARVDHCTVDCRVTQVLDRHYPGSNAILVEQADGQVELDENLVTASPQWGIRVRGSQTDGALVHHNRVIGTKALVANGYMLGIHSPNVEAYENELRGESRGIHIDGVDESGRNAWIHDNRVECQDQPNPEYPDRHWVHGVKVETAPGCRVERNHVRGTADAQHGDAFALDMQTGTETGILVRHNVFEAISVTPSLFGQAVRWTYGNPDGPTDALVHQNVFTATDTLVFRSWDAVGGGLFWCNWWHRDLSQGAGHEFDFEYFWNSDDDASRGHRFLDAHPPALARDVGQRAGAAAYDSTREGTLTVLATDGTTPLAGATVTVRNAAGQAAWQGTTDAAGRVAGIVRYARLTNGPTFTEDGPHAVTVARTGFTTWQGPVTVEGRTALLVDLAAGTGMVDATAPTTPTQVEASPLSASRALVRWDVSEDDVAVAVYLVFLNGRPAAITEALGAYLGGLEADTSYAVTVQSVDAGGRVSASSDAIPFRTRPEDRGP